jgi:hypothetical protein
VSSTAEYDRAVDLADSQHEAESELRGRSKRHEQLELRSLNSFERENFERSDLVAITTSSRRPTRARPRSCSAGSRSVAGAAPDRDEAERRFRLAQWTGTATSSTASASGTTIGFGRR